MTEIEFAGLRQIVADTVPDVAGMTDGRTGNLSAREGDRVAITPSGIPYDEIDASAVPVLSPDGERLAGSLAPSSETAMHLGLYRSMDFGAIVHAHAPWATTLAVLHEELPPVHYMLAAAGGTVPVVPYEPFGTAALADAVIETMGDAETSAAILANHGLVAGGEDMGSAIETAIAVESTARLYLQASAIGDPVPLTDAQFQGALEQFEAYGQ
ncbi:MAG: class II aldolase/adducin family protein [Halodesulfurarchaeum sp.]